MSIMRIIANAKDLRPAGYDGTVQFHEFLKAQDKVSVLDGIFNAINEIYEERTEESDMSLFEMRGNRLLLEVLIGAEEPTRFIKEAETWNETIRKMVLDAMCEAKPLLENGEVTGQHTNKLWKTAMMADDRWSDCSTYGVLQTSHGDRYFKVMMPEAMLADIRQNPGDYIIIVVYPKYNM